MTTPASNDLALREALERGILDWAASLDDEQDPNAPTVRMVLGNRADLLARHLSTSLAPRSGSVGEPIVRVDDWHFGPERASQPPAAPETSEGWRCFHCDEVFTDKRCAAAHFGATEDSQTACLIKAGAEGSLLRALRDAEEQSADAIAKMHDESTDAAKAYHRAVARHSQALIAAEESGYEKGLADGRELSLPAVDAGRRRLPCLLTVKAHRPSGANQWMMR